jgi:acyl-CoA synthetase (AMP-forming)/AMP-acid ligase II
MTQTLVDPHLTFATVAALCRGVAARHPRREALVADGIRLSFAELDARTDQVARGLRARGIGRHSTIAMLLLDGVAMIELIIASAKLGATLLTLNWRLAAPEIAYILSDAQPALLFVSARFSALAGQDGVGECPRILVADGDPKGAGAALGGGGSSPRSELQAEVTPDLTWYMIYTSGTTGRPKGCMHSQGGYYASTLSLLSWCGFREADRCLLNYPLFHVAGLSLFLAWFAAGACTVVAPAHQNAEELLDLVTQERITVQGVPMLLLDDYLRLARERRPQLALRLMLAGAGMTLQRRQEISRTLNLEVVLGFGQSEAGGFHSFLRPEDHEQRPASAGKTLPHLEARIIRDDGSEAPDGERGELLLRGPGVTLGYLKLPDATAQTLNAGWLHTGDIFWRDADGFMFFTGRKKELIKTAGENVYPAEVEQVIMTHPAVAEVCVAGVPDERFIEAVKAFVVLRPGASVSPQEIADWCRRSIAGYKRPRYVEFVDALPRNSMGKLQPAELLKRPLTPEQSCG